MILVIASSQKELQGISQFSQKEGAVRQLPNGASLIAVTVGVGKVQASLGTLEAIKKLNPTLVIGVGSCGAVSTDVAVGDLVIPSHVLQYDIDLRRFGLARGEVFGPEGKKVGWLAADCLPQWTAESPHEFAGRPVWRNVAIGSADRFLSPKDRGTHRFLVDELHLVAVDMESYAMVAAARRTQVPIAIIRAVSDTWDGKKADSLPKFLEESSRSIFRFIATYC